jgi:stage V sporulation protein G
MQITEVKVFPVAEEKLKAFVSIVIDGCFMVNDIKVIQGKDGLFISMPSRRKKNGEFKDVAHPLNSDTRRLIEGQVLAEYERVRDGRAATPASARNPPGVAAAPEAPEAEAPPPAAPEADRSLEEVEELHLRDSFWTVS